MPKITNYLLMFAQYKIDVTFYYRFASLPDYSVPEILRVPLEELCLHILVGRISVILFVRPKTLIFFII